MHDFVNSPCNPLDADAHAGQGEEEAVMEEETVGDDSKEAVVEDHAGVEGLDADGDAECEPCLPLQGLPTPRCPSQQEREEHELHHLDYRSWCDVCVSELGARKPRTRRSQASPWSSTTALS